MATKTTKKAAATVETKDAAAKPNMDTVAAAHAPVKTLADYLGGLPSKATDYTSAEQLKQLQLAFGAAKADGNEAVQAEIRAIGVAAQAQLKKALAPVVPKAKKVEKTVELLPRKELAALAKEANKVMSLDPVIDAKAGTDAELQERLVAELADIRQEDVTKVKGEKKDVFSLTSLALIVRLGLSYPGAPNAKPARKAAGPKKEAGPKSVFGHRGSSSAGAIDEALAKGGTMEDITKSVGCSAGRVNAHIAHLTTKCGVKVDKNEKTGVLKAKKA